MTSDPSDYDQIINVVDEWWGRDVGSGLPRLFLDHFWATSLIAEEARAMAALASTPPTTRVGPTCITSA